MSWHSSHDLVHMKLRQLTAEERRKLKLARRRRPPLGYPYDYDTCTACGYLDDAPEATAPCSRATSAAVEVLPATIGDAGADRFLADLDAKRRKAEPIDVDGELVDERQVEQLEQLEQLEPDAIARASYDAESPSSAIATVAGDDEQLDADLDELEATERAAIAALPPEARAELGALEARSREHERAATALNTRRTYRSRWASFCEWCALRGLSSLPAHADVVRLYLVALEREGLSLSTLVVSLAAIRKAHLAAAVAVPRSERLGQALTGLRRTLGPRATRPDAIGLEELRAMVRTCSATDPFGIRDRAILLTTYFSAGRRSEVTGFDVDGARRDPEGFVLRVAQSKVDQAGEGAEVGLPVLRDPELCPVRALEQWLALRAILAPTSPALFVSLEHKKPNGLFDVKAGGRLDPGDVARRIKARARAAGFNATRFKAHGFRAGFATEASRRGASIKGLQAHLRHGDLESTLRYVRAGAVLGADNPGRWFK